MAKPTSIWWERAAAIFAVVALAASLFSAHASCGSQDLTFSGSFPSETPRQTATPTETPQP